MPKLRKIETAPNKLKMTLNATRPKISLYYVELLPVNPKFHAFLLYDRSFPRSSRFFIFSIGYNGEFGIFEKKIVKNRKLKNFNNPQRSIVKTILRKNQDKFENFWLNFGVKI